MYTNPCTILTETIPRLWGYVLNESMENFAGSSSMLFLGAFEEEEEGGIPMLPIAVERISNGERISQGERLCSDYSDSEVCSVNGALRTNSLPAINTDVCFQEMGLSRKLSSSIMQSKDNTGGSGQRRSVSFDEVRYVGVTHTKNSYSRGHSTIFRKQDVAQVRMELDVFKRYEMNIHPESRENTLVYSELSMKRREKLLKKKNSIEKFEQIYSDSGNSDSDSECASYSKPNASPLRFGSSMINMPDSDSGADSDSDYNDNTNNTNNNNEPALIAVDTVQ
eukprot:Pgem_evm1s721